MSLREELFKELEHEIQYYTEHTKAQYRAHVSDYLDFVRRKDPSYESWKTRDMVYAYMDYLLKRKKNSQQHISYQVHGPIGALFRFSGLRIPVRLPRTVSGIYSENSEAFFWKEDQVALMIKTARKMGLPMQALMAVTTIYAPRINEIVKISKKNIDWGKMIITIQTSKHNLIRRHLIPEAIQYPVCKYEWPPLTELKLRDMFENLLNEAGIQRLRRQSFHAFRHTLWTALSDVGFTDDEVYKFTGWRKGGTLGAYVPLKLNPANDTKIYEKHPFLKYWEG